MNLSFLNSLILVGLGSAIIPILIHLFIKYKPKIVYFSSLKYIKEVQKQKSRIMRLRELLLLITRILIIAFFILALARPVLQGLFSEKSSTHAPTAIALIIDNSYSMNYLEEDVPLLESAKKMAEDVLSMLNNRDKVVLLTLDKDINQREGYFSHVPQLMQKLQEISISDNTADMKDVVSFADQKLKDLGMINQEIYVITDEQNVPWIDIEDVSLESDLFVLPVSSDNRKKNTASLAVQYIPQILSAENRPEIRALVKNFSSVEMSNVLVSLVLNNITRAEMIVDLDPFQARQLIFDVPEGEGMFQFGEVRIKDELLPDDNVFFFNFPVETEPKICVISSETIPLALSSILDIITDGEWKLINPLEMNERIVMQNQLFIIYAPTAFNDKMKYFADDILSTGKSLFIIPDDQMHAREELKEWLISQDIHYRALYDNEQEIEFVNPAHPICNIMTPELLQTTRIYKIWNIHSPGFIPLISTNENNAILAIRDNLLIASIDLTKSWSNIIYQTSFPVLMYNIGHYLGSPASQITQLETGKSIPLGLEGEFSCQLPNGEIIPLSVTPQNNLFTQTEQQGHYFVYDENRLIKVLSFNAPRDESDLEQLTEQQKALISGKVPQIHFLTSESWKNEILRSRYGYELWRQFFWILLVFLLLEMTLAYSGKRLRKK
ncbi:MAG TPA: VWA domain-containing protein [Candidatus Cloacimonetes bacterium]|nr:VWA domain-containing protein [Candidatus Cloacimonadota bacterium]HEX37919.1 VWA domain-containing protein [Candidatus Cloacimonadota bacterium]